MFDVFEYGFFTELEDDAAGWQLELLEELFYPAEKFRI